MNILGISAGSHDAAATVISPHGDILFAGHSERYSRVKNDPNINIRLISDALKYEISDIAFHERPWLKQLRQLYSGQGIDFDSLTTGQIIRQQLPQQFHNLPIKSYPHHLSHAAAGFQTSKFDRATVVVIDAIGEWDTIGIYAADYDKLGRARYRRLWSLKYPHSIGLFYSAMTEKVGLKPNEEEYILMGMSAYGRQGLAASMMKSLVADPSSAKFKYNMHIGLPDDSWDHIHSSDLALAAQQVLESLVNNIMLRARNFGWSKNLVYAGGVALNCLANRNLGDYFDHIWIMPNPGDAGSSLGAAALRHGGRINWVDAYLGYNIARPLPVNDILDELLKGNIVGVANGPAEFGPRALGNRSLLADPRGDNIKEKVNEIKHRQKFRPFAPVILEEYAQEYFIMPSGWDNFSYMQVVGTCLDPRSYPAITHSDGSSRVQSVGRDSRSGIRELLEKWFVITGCPMLLNTSLNIRGEPMVNDEIDAKRFAETYKIKVF
jgi:carbamoyltransferase